MRALVTMLVAGLIAGCGPQAAVPTTTPSTFPSESPLATSTSTPSLVPVSPSPTPSPSQAAPSQEPTPTPSPLPTEAPFVVKWTEASRIADESFLYSDVRLRAFKGRFLALVADSMIWISGDALTWEPALDLRDPEGSSIEITDFAVGDERAVAVGRDQENDHGAIWTSTDGVSWERRPDLLVAIDTVGTTNTGFVGVGGGILWRSVDGATWDPATDTTSEHIAAGAGRLFSMKGETVVFVRGANGLELWQTTGASWSKLGELPKSKDARIFNTTRGPRGWVAIGWNDAGFSVWFSETGTSWQRADPDTVPQEASVQSVIALDPGFVAVGYSGDQPGVTCGSGEPLVAHTWTSTDGLKWKEMEQDIPGAAFLALYARSQTLYVLGGKEMIGGVVWSAPLPVVAKTAKGVTPYRAPGTGGCGP
jgi:hypothetical protein